MADRLVSYIHVADLLHLLEEQSDQGLHCLRFRLHLFGVHYSLVKPSCLTFRVITANFMVSEFLGFLRYVRQTRGLFEKVPIPRKSTSSKRSK